ncbi:MULTISPECIES: type II toxin-antitoxin system RelE/ParE family toxin [unclassified Rhizobium]|uniref:type II toxin-antitoxin system RelE/ParE family toxin n=1 Tax=unclassified Rhizobium TaxID=2613769 RepID=UPI001ADA00DF|nr:MULTISPECIES: type II toxin-antitoxin system RelE/ParE family toxin [unclassified Rhizobium]MBO9123171.1 type II toxin-antitoxin system RelE/ParE family toxin [Rhizobium sp. 16-488-2b]MBO9173703.1 type II toxin-antitoxin system RelE/ParE family toxin [Rhizobium sp. 16-488-2a]
MKAYGVTFRGAAQRDLKSIFDYVLERSGSRQTAVLYLKRLRDRCSRIGDAPFGGVARPDLGANLRLAVFERSIVILYRVEAETILITNIFSGGRDYETLMRDHR